MASTRDYYEVLGIPKTATAADIKSAYRKAALKFHPDRNKEPGAETKFKEINEAYEVLGNEEKRKNYDQFGHQAFQQGGFNSASGPNPFAGGFGGQGGPFSYTYTGNPFSAQGGPASGWEGMDFGGFSDPFDIFESFFGGSMRRGPRKPHYELEVSFMEAVKGAEKNVEIDGKKKTIKVPAGADNGTRVRFADFDVSFRVRPDPKFRRDGEDIYTDVNLPFYQAILGGEIEVPTLDGSLRLKVRPGTQPGTMVRLRDYGVSRLQGRGKGDQYIRYVVTIPEKLSHEEREALKVFEK
ncbi:MAG TPA: DnaJ C-terminal domain-containing protein [Patescibacteria group bacterium]|nr:DnaJ C-terminal domain-containing protein [Patescibacteria group bacterium]